MKYTVVWQPDAEEHLAKIWLQANDRRQITSAADSIDAQLRVRPGEVK